MNPLSLSAGIAAAGSMASGLVNSFTQNRNIKLQNKYNREMAQYAYSKDLEMWNRGNLYNSPQAQMQRLKEAGLNPHLIYGGAPGNQSAQLPKYQAPTQVANHLPPVDPGEIISRYQDYAIKGAQLDNLKAERDVKEENAKSKGFANAITEAAMQEIIKKHGLGNEKTMAAIAALQQTTEQKEQMFPFQLEAIQSNTGLKNAQISKTIQDMLLSQERKTGVTLDNTYKGVRNKYADSKYRWETQQAKNKAIISSFDRLNWHTKFNNAQDLIKAKKTAQDLANEYFADKFWGDLFGKLSPIVGKGIQWGTATLRRAMW